MFITGQNQIMKIKRIIISLCAALVCAIANNASAVIVSYGFSGTVTSIMNPSNAVPSGVVYGTPFTGIFTYNTETNMSGPDFAPSTNSGDFYFSTNGGFLLSVSIAGHVLSVIKHTSPDDPTAYFIVHNDYAGYDSLEVGDSSPNVLMDGAQLPGNQVKCYASLSFYDNSATALNTDALPSTPPTLASFPNTHRLEVNAYGPALMFDFIGTITNISVMPRLGLSIHRVAGDNVTLSWPLAAQGFDLEQNTNLTTGAGWQTNFTSIIDTATDHTVTMPVSDPACFFRLKSP
jgi:hypothetical protein